MDRGVQDQIAFRRQLDIGKGFADAFGKGVVAVYKYRHIGAQAEAEFFQCGSAEAGLPEMVEPEQYGGCIGRTAAEAATHW